MLKIPDKIYVQQVNPLTVDNIKNCNWFERSWSVERQNKDDEVFIKQSINKIEEIEQLLAGWKAAAKEQKEDGNSGIATEYNGIARGLTAALRIIDEPSNDNNATGEVKWE